MISLTEAFNELSKGNEDEVTDIIIGPDDNHLQEISRPLTPFRNLIALIIIGKGDKHVSLYNDTLPELPYSLQTLVCNKVVINIFPERLPDGLITMQFYNVRLTKLPPFPNSLHLCTFKTPIFLKVFYFIS